jgi:hypothetical protein
MIAQSQQFHLCNYDDAIGFPKVASGTVAGLATMILSPESGVKAMIRREAASVGGFF